MSRLSGRTISALKKAGVSNPQKRTLDYLIRLPNIGITAITEIADRWYHGMGHLDEHWPELDDRPPPVIRKCSHRVPIAENCPKCISDMRERGVIE